MNVEPAGAVAAREDPRSTIELISAALSETDEHAVWSPIGILKWRGTREIFEAARGLCDSECPCERDLGATILGELGLPTRAFPDESVAILNRMLDSEEDEEVLGAIAFAMGHLRHEGAVASLVKRKNHPSADVRYAVVFGLLTHETDPAITALIELSTDEDDDVRDWAAFGLGSQIDTDTPAIREALIQRLADPHDDTRAEALVGLARRHDERVVEPLIEELAGEWVGRMAVEAAQELGDVRLLPGLLELREWWDVDVKLLDDAISRCQAADRAATRA